jgi:hypothetical protein
LTFLVALGAYCFHNMDTIGEQIFLAAILGVFGICAFATSLFFWTKSANKIKEETEDISMHGVVDAIKWVKTMTVKTGNPIHGK